MIQAFEWYTRFFRTNGNRGLIYMTEGGILESIWQLPLHEIKESSDDADVVRVPMLSFRMPHFFFALGLSLLTPSFCFGTLPEEKSVWQLKRDVEQRERQLTVAQRELSEARARAALAEGHRDQGIAELRKAVACYEEEVQWIRDHANWFCDPREPTTQAEWNLAKASVWLAEVEGNAKNLVTQRKKIVGFHQEQLERVRRLIQMRAVKPDEENAVQLELEKARQHLADAEQLLAAKTGKAN